MDEQSKKDIQHGIDSTFLRVLSHQLKSPIDAIQSLLQTIYDGFTGETNVKTLHFIERAVKRASEVEDMVSDLLDYQLYSENPSNSK